MLDALGRLGHPGGSSAYFRLSTRVIDQDLAQLPSNPDQREQRRRQVLAGGYLLHVADGVPAITLVGMGAIIPEVLEAAKLLRDDGIESDVICITSADLIFRALQARKGLDECDDAILDVLFPLDRTSPIVTVLDGHPHTLSFLAGIHPTRITCLGVNDFGQSGDIPDLYQHFGIDADTIAGAAFDLVDVHQT
jgi:pyruvate dehydrogenase E1 component